MWDFLSCFEFCVWDLKFRVSFVVFRVQRFAFLGLRLQDATKGARFMVHDVEFMAHGVSFRVYGRAFPLSLLRVPRVFRVESVGRKRDRPCPARAAPSPRAPTRTLPRPPLRGM